MSEGPEHRNEVTLVGRLSAPPEERELPSGDTIVVWRLVIDREDRLGRPDVLDCVAWTRALQRSVTGWAPGDVVSVAGALRRRFWRGEGGPASRYEVEAQQVRRLARAARLTRPRGRASTTRSPASA